MKRKIFTFTLALAMAMGVCGSVYAQTRTASLVINGSVMNVDGQDQTIDAPPVIINSRTFVPVRAIVEAVGGSVTWDAETKTAMLYCGDDFIELTVGSKTAFLDDAAFDLDDVPIISDGRTMLPLRFIAEGFGFDTDWDAETKTITITKEEEDTHYDETDFYEEDYGRYGDDDLYYTVVMGNYEVRDQNGRTLEKYTDMGKIESFFIDKDGKTCTLVEDEKKAVFTKADGTKTVYTLGEDYNYSDSKGNRITYASSRSKNYLNIRNKNDEIIERYTQAREINFYYADQNGKEAHISYENGGKADDWFIKPDGTKVKLERNTAVTFIDSDGEYFNYMIGWLTPYDKNGVLTSDIEISDEYDVYVDNKGDEYKVYYNADDIWEIEYPNGEKVTLKLVDQQEKTAYTIFIYEGSDGLTYATNEEAGFDVSDRNGTTKKLYERGYTEEYKTAAGVYKYEVFNGNSKLTKPNGKTVDLTLTYG